MEELLERLAQLMNKEMSDYDITIKDYALRCGISYTLMRRICNGKATDLMLSTVIKICDNSHFGINEIIDKKELDIERVFPQCSILYGNSRYSINLSKYK